LVEKLKKSKLALWILPLVSAISLIILSYISIIQIESLKKQVDKIYFGNYVQVNYLYQCDLLLKDNIILIQKKRYSKIKKNNKLIKKFWNYYKNSYKTKKEREVIKKIDKIISKTTKHIIKKYYLLSISKIQKLIKYETEVAFLERKRFLKKYNQMQTTLFYIIGFILIITVAITIIVSYVNFKKETKLQNLIKKYKLDSITDGMTKLYNKKYFNSLLDNVVRDYATANNTFVAFIMIDIDNFKKYNDNYGHDKGDDALIAVAKVLKNTLNSKNDFVFRLGGEEFGALVFDTNEAKLKNILETLRVNVLNLKIEHKYNENHGIVTISIGAILIKPYESRTPRDIYIGADKMLYKSKENGRNQWHILV